MNEETWDAVAKVATMERVLAANGSPSDITTLIEESVRVALVTELRRIAAAAHEAAQSFTTAKLHVRRDDYATFARTLREQARKLERQ